MNTKMRILIAEDESITRRLLESTLTKWGYEVVITRNGTEALEELQKETRPMLAILDWFMPGMDGIKIIPIIREQPETKPLYIIVLSMMTLKEGVIEALRAGADDYVTKPFDEEELRARLLVGVRIVEKMEKLYERIQP